MAASSAGLVSALWSASCARQRRTATAWSRAASVPSSRRPPTSTKHLPSAAPIRSTPPRASTFSLVMSNKRYLKLVLPRLATRTFIAARFSRLLAEEDRHHVLFRTGDDVGADQLAVLAGRRGAGIDRGTDRADVAAHERGDIGAADLNL